MHKLYPTLSVIALTVSCALHAAEKTGDSAQANNPLANMTAFNMQNYYIGNLSGSSSGANQFWLRFAQPFTVDESNWILRASLPVNTYPTAPDGGHQTGLGDLNLFTAWLMDTGNPAVSFGFGPQLTAPTASRSSLGSEKWSAGLVNVLFNASSPVIQYGYLASWQHSFAGDDGRSTVNVAAFQPFMFYQLGGGTYLRSSPIWNYNFQNDSYGVPLGLGVGQIIKQDKTVYNFFIEPQGSIADRGPGQPRWQIFAGLNIQFLN